MFAVDASFVPETLATEDAVSQDDIARAIHASLSHETAHDVAEFDALPTRSIYLSTMRKHYERKDVHAAMRSLMFKTKLVVDPEYLIDSASQDINWRPSHHLDYTLAVPVCPGLGAVLPTTVDHTFSMKLNLQSPHIEFPGTSESLGFQPVHNMMSIGVCGMQSLFLALPDRSCVGVEALRTFEPTPSKESTRMSPIDGRIAIALMCWMIERATVRDAYVVGYPDISSMAKLRLSTNIL